MKSKVNLIFFALLMFSFVGFSQNKDAEGKTTMEFKETTHDFGKIKAEDGPVSHTFKFKNSGKVPLIIYNVKASCGCTTPDWSKKPVAPGAEGFIKATFNPSGRRNSFKKSITVNANTPNSVEKVYINGFIVEKPKTMAELYPNKVEGLRFKTLYIRMGTVGSTRSRTKVINYANDSEADITLTFKNVPKHISLNTTPKVLKPKQTGKIVLTYDGAKAKGWDYITDKCNLVVNGKELTNKQRILTISATRIPDLSKLTAEERANAPIMKFESTKFYFENVTSGEKLTYEYKFKNEGKTDLEIYHTKANCSCIKVTPSAKKVKPGEEGSIKIVFDTYKRKGKQYKTVTLLTNDPKSSRKTLTVNGLIK